MTKLFLVGADSNKDLWQKTFSKENIKKLGDMVLGVEFILLDNTSDIEKIKKEDPNAIIGGLHSITNNYHKLYITEKTWFVEAMDGKKIDFLIHINHGLYSEYTSNNAYFMMRFPEIPIVPMVFNGKTLELGAVSNPAENSRSILEVQNIPIDYKKIFKEIIAAKATKVSKVKPSPKTSVPDSMEPLQKNTVATLKEPDSGDQVLSQIITILINNITKSTNGRKTSGTNSEKVRLLEEISTEINKKEFKTESTEFKQYKEKISNICTIKRNPLHFWKTSSSEKEFSILIKPYFLLYPQNIKKINIYLVANNDNGGIWAEEVLIKKNLDQLNKKVQNVNFIPLLKIEAIKQIKANDPHAIFGALFFVISSRVDEMFSENHPLVKAINDNIIDFSVPLYQGLDSDYLNHIDYFEYLYKAHCLPIVYTPKQLHLHFELGSNVNIDYKERIKSIIYSKVSGISKDEFINQKKIIKKSKKVNEEESPENFSLNYMRGDQFLIDMVSILISNITNKFNERKTSGANSDKVKRLKKIRSEIGRCKTFSRDSDEFSRYKKQIEQISTTHRNCFNFWKKPHSAKEFIELINTYS